MSLNTNESARNIVNSHEVTYSETIDDYKQGKPVIKNLLIISLSIFPSEVGRSTIKTGDKSYDYYQQQEPFPLHLADKLKENGEILILVTPETLEIKDINFTDNEITSEITSVQKYFETSIKNKISNKIIIKSIRVKQDDPVDAISDAVEHLREIKENNQQNNSDPPTIYLGTNGGLRGTQLIFEAILSLLKNEGITVNPRNVFSIQGSYPNFNLIESGVEFKIFDFVSGMNEFFNYGQIKSLEDFKKENSDLFADENAKNLFDYLKEISEGIQFCSINNFQSGLKKLDGLDLEQLSKDNHYIKMFRENIKKNFTTKDGKDILNEHLVLDEIKWCIEKGFYQQAFTLCEGALPKDFMAKKIIVSSIPKEIISYFKDFDDDDDDIAIFNKIIIKNIPKHFVDKDIDNISENDLNRNIKNQKITIDNNNMISMIIYNNMSFKKILAYHRKIKHIRNKLNHPSSNNQSITTGTTQNYLDTITKYINLIENYYNDRKTEKVALSLKVEAQKKTKSQPSLKQPINKKNLSELSKLHFN